MKWNRLFLKYKPQIEAAVSKRLYNRSDAADIVQDAFIRLSQIQDWDMVQNPKAYMFRTAHNLATDQMRKKKLETEHQMIAQTYINEGAYTSLTPEKITIDRAELKQLRTILGELSPNCREAFLLHRLDGLTYEQIGQKMGISKHMVKKHIVRALKYCRKALYPSDN